MTNILLTYTIDFKDPVERYTNAEVTKSLLVKGSATGENVSAKLGDKNYNFPYHNVSLSVQPTTKFKRIAVLAHGQKINGAGTFASVCGKQVDKPLLSDVDYFISATSLLKNVIAPNLVDFKTDASILLLVCWGGYRSLETEKNSYADFLFLKPSPYIRPANLKYIIGCKSNIAVSKIPDLLNAYTKVSKAEDYPTTQVPYECKDFVCIK